MVVHERERARRHVAEGERGRAGAAQAIAPEPAGDIGRDRPGIGRADREQRARPQRGGLEAQRAPVQPRAVPYAGREHLAREGIVDDPGEGSPVAQHADGHREAGNPAAEIVGPVHGIDQPEVPVQRRRRVRPALLSQHPVTGECGPDLPREEVLDGEVGIRDHRIVVLPRHARALEVPHQDAPRSQGEPDEGLEARLRRPGVRHAIHPGSPGDPPPRAPGPGPPACPARFRRDPAAPPAPRASR